MKILMIKRKAASRKELGREVYELPEVHNLRELLWSITEIEYRKQFDTVCVSPVLSKEELHHHAEQGKIVFHESYDTRRDDLDSAKQRVLQDYEDGLFRVFVHGEEVGDLEEDLQLQEGDEIVFIRLVMLAGRLW